MAALAALLTAVSLALASLAAWAQPPDEVRLVDATGRVLVRIAPQPRAFRLADTAGASLGEVRVEADRVKLRDATGVERWKIKRKEYGAEIETGSGERLYRLRARGSEWRVEDAAKVEVARLVVAGSGAEVRGGSTPKVRVKAGGAGLVVEAEGDRRVAEVAGSADVRAGAWLALDRFSPVERAALWIYFTTVGR